MPKKKITNKFYNIDFVTLVALSKAPQEQCVRCSLRGEITTDTLKELKERFEFYNNDIDPEGCVWFLDGAIKIADIAGAKEYLKEKDICLDYDRYTYKEVKDEDGYLMSGWRTGRRTKIKAEDLPESFIRVTSYKKNGYIDTAKVIDVAYKRSPFHNHTYKDDFLMIAYEGDKMLDTSSSDSLFSSCHEYIFGNDIIDVVFAIEKNNKENAEVQKKIQKIKSEMVEQYNAFVDEMSKFNDRTEYKKIATLEELMERR